MRTVNSVIAKPAELLHIADTATFENATGVFFGDAEHVVERYEWDLPRVPDDLAAFCGQPVFSGGRGVTDCATVRALRLEPSMFEEMPMCGECLRVFARLQTDGLRP